jgi:hypothetical protein
MNLGGDSRCVRPSRSDIRRNRRECDTILDERVAVTLTGRTDSAGRIEGEHAVRERASVSLSALPLRFPPPGAAQENEHRRKKRCQSDENQNRRTLACSSMSRHRP